MRKKYLDLLYMPAVVCLLCACSQKNSREVISISDIQFTNSIDLSYHKLHTDYLLSYPKNILLVKEHLVIQDDRGHKFFYHVINKETGELEYEFGERGNGPEEMLSTSINPFYNKEKDEIQMYDANKKTIFYKPAYSKRLNSEKTTTIPTQYNLFLTQLIDYGDYYVAAGKNGLFDHYRFIIFDKSFNIIKKLEEYPVFDKERGINNEIRENAFNIYFLKTSPDRRNIVFASYETGLLEIFDASLLPNTMVKKKSLLLKTPFNKKSEKINGFEDIYVTDKYIYTLYNGETVEDNPYYAKKINIFDLNGNFIAEYNAGVDLRCLAVDEDEKVIYAAAYTDEDGFFLIKTDRIEYI